MTDWYEFAGIPPTERERARKPATDWYAFAGITGDTEDDGPDPPTLPAMRARPPAGREPAPTPPAAEPARRRPLFTNPFSEEGKENRRRAAGGGGQMLRGLAESGYSTAAGATRLLGIDSATAALERSREEMREFYGEPEGAGQVASGVVGRLAGDVAQFMSPGALVARAGVLPAVATTGVRGAAARTAINTGVAAPITAAQAGDPESSTTKFLADATAGGATQPTFLQRVASTPAGRVAGDLVLDAATGGAVEGIAAGVRAGRAAVRPNPIQRGADVGRSVGAQIRQAAAAGPPPDPNALPQGPARMEAAPPEQTVQAPTPQAAAAEPPPMPTQPGEPLHLRSFDAGFKDGSDPFGSPMPPPGVDPEVYAEGYAAAQARARAAERPAELPDGKVEAPLFFEQHVGNTATERTTGSRVPLEATLRDPERVRSAALRYRGKVYEGGTHGDAANRAVDDGDWTEAMADKYGVVPIEGLDEGFVTTSGRYVSREEAKGLAKAGKQMLPGATDAKWLDALEVDLDDAAALAPGKAEWTPQMQVEFYRGQLIHLGDAPESASAAARRIVELPEESVEREVLFQKERDRAILARMRRSLGITDTPAAEGGGVRGLSDQRNTPQFRNWFGESRVRDEAGDPLTVYHGSANEGFDRFDPQRINPEDPDAPYNGFFFTADPGDAKYWAGWQKDAPAGKGEVRAFHLALKNPAPRAEAERVAREVGEDWATHYPGARSRHDAVRMELEARGYDGVLHSPATEDAAAVYVAFRPEQIKSATDNSGAFDPRDPNVYGFARQGVVNTLAGAGAGGVAGGIADEDNRLRGAALGGAAGAGLGAAATRLGSPAAAPAPAAAYASDPDVLGILKTVARATPAGRKPVWRRLAEVKDAAGESAHNIYTRVFDEAHPLRRFGRDVGGSDSLSHEVSRGAGWRGAADVRLRTEFKEGVLDVARGHENGVVALAKAERALELARNGMPEKGVDLDQAQRLVARLGDVPEVRAGADALRGYYRNLLDRRLENGVITKDAYDALLAKGEFYIPFVRDFGEELHPFGARGGKRVNRGTGVRKMKDVVAEQKTVDPFEQAILDTYQTEREVAKQRVSNMVARIVEEHPDAAAAFVRRIPNRDTAAKSARVVEANVEGRRAYFEVKDEDLYNAWAAMDPHTQGIVAATLAPFKKALQTTVTSLPDFMLANAIRDNVMTATQNTLPVRNALAGSAAGAAIGGIASENDRGGGALRGAAVGLGVGGVGPQVARTLSAVRSIVKDDDIYREWAKEGGAGFGFYARTPDDASKVLTMLRKEGVRAGDVISPRTWWETLQRVGQVVEQAPRLARYKASRGAGREIPAAVFDARDVSLDFSVQGRDMKGMNAVAAFYNAKLQGWSKLTRMLKNPRTWAVGAATITAPSIALWTVNKDNPEYWERPQWERNMFWLLPKAGGGFWRVPKPFEVGFIFASVPERLLDFAHQRDPEQLAFTLRSMMQTTTEGTFPVPTALEPILENAVNHDFFRAAPVVRPGLERLPTEMQYDDKTSSVAVGLGRLTGASPQKVDNIIQGYTGTIGQQVSDLVSRGARAAGVDDRPAPPQKAAPLVGRFMTRPDQTTDQETTLRRRFERAERARTGLLELIKRGDDDAAEDFFRRHEQEVRAYYDLKPQSEVLKQAGEIRRAIHASREHTPEEKRQLLIELNNEVSARLQPPAAGPR
ncbi:MAG: hypothetical protein KY467_01220 [Gemmatimonadetes bacterium]|nr:hypothetical protein [Gemmatimonadota bacterium]